MYKKWSTKNIKDLKDKIKVRERFGLFQIKRNLMLKSKLRILLK